MPATPAVIIVDDDPFVRDSLAQLVKSMDLAVVCFDSAERFLDSADLSRPGCIVLDICLPGLSGLSLHEALSEYGAHPPVIIVSGHADIPTAVRAMKLGVFDFLEKPYFPKQLVEIIRCAIKVDAKQREEASELECSRHRLEKLTPEERAVLDGIGAGKTNKLIADELDISLRTIQFRRSSICRKLQLNSRPELVRAALSARQLDT